MSGPQLGEMLEGERNLPLSHAAKRIRKVTFVTQINILCYCTLENQHVVPKLLTTSCCAGIVQHDTVLPGRDQDTMEWKGTLVTVP